MDTNEIYELAGALAQALKTEYATKCTVEGAKASAEIAVSLAIGQAIAIGEIDGKNADTRKAQKAAILAGSKDYQASLREVADAEVEAAGAEIERRRVEAIVGLTKAWLYSQGGH